MEPARPIALIGLAGTGKSTVGRLLAARLSRRFVDLDDVIVADAGRSIAEIFRTDGEPAFRALERAALLRTLGEEGVVMATGGGAACREDSLADLLARAHVVTLAATPAEVLRRTGNHSGRPLVDGAADPLTAITRLAAAREPFYRRAHLRIETEGKAPEEIVAEIVTSLGKEREAS